MASSENEAEVGGVPISLKWFEGVMQRALKTDATLKSARGHRVDEGKGYTSLIASIQMEWNPPDPKLLAEVVAKVMMVSKLSTAFEDMQTAHGGDKDKVVTFDEMMESVPKGDDGEKLDIAVWVHTNECLIYDLLTKKGVEPSPVLTPKCYHYEKHSKQAGSDPGVILFEDLSKRGKVPQFGDNLTIGQTRAIFSAIAKLHAWSFRTPDMFKDKKLQPLMSRQQLDMFPSMMMMGIDALKRMPLAKDIIKISEADVKELIDVDTLWEMYSPDSNKHTPLVLVHGDMWAHNMFFGYDPSTKTFTDELVALIDWQTAHPGNCVEDMVRFLSSSVDYRLRREYEYKLIDEYYAQLEQELKGTGVSIPYSVDDVKVWYKKALPMGIAMMTTHAPLVLSTPATADAYTDEQKLNLVWRVQGGLEDLCA